MERITSNGKTKFEIRTQSQRRNTLPNFFPISKHKKLLAVNKIKPKILELKKPINKKISSSVLNITKQFKRKKSIVPKPLSPGLGNLDNDNICTNTERDTPIRYFNKTSKIPRLMIKTNGEFINPSYLSEKRERWYNKKTPWMTNQYYLHNYVGSFNDMEKYKKKMIARGFIANLSDLAKCKPIQ